MEHKTLKTALFSITLFLSFCFPSSAQTCNSYTFSTNNVFANCTDLPVLNTFLHWTYEESTGTVNIAFRHTGTTDSNWVAWGLNPTGPQMLGTQAIVAFRNSSGEFHAYTAPVTRLDTRLQQGSLSFGVSRISASLVGGEAIIFATLELPSEMISTNQLWQVGPVSNGVPGIHQTSGDNMRSAGSINFRSGQAAAGGGNLIPRLKRKNTHGVLSAVSWGILMPMGAIMARYVKVFADPAWFYLHIACQGSAFVVGVAGWATGIKLGNDSPGIKYSKHRNIGITLLAFGILQVFALLLRPKPDNKYRFYWNIYHHAIGYATIILSIINVFEGFDILDPADKWKWAYIGILIFLGASALVLEAVTWVVVLRRKTAGGGSGRVGAGGASNKFSNTSNGNVNGHGASRTQQMV